jgi:hypothetical protein
MLQVAQWISVHPQFRDSAKWTAAGISMRWSDGGAEWDGKRETAQSSRVTFVTGSDVAGLRIRQGIPVNGK